jgi:hypothetical protein
MPLMLSGDEQMRQINQESKKLDDFVSAPENRNQVIVYGTRPYNPPIKKSQVAEAFINRFGNSASKANLPIQ